LRDSAAPLDLIPDHGLWPWWLAAGIIVLLGIALIIHIKTRKPGAVDIAAARESAYRDASAGLQQCAPEDAREAAVQSSLILRKYLSIAAADPALFETHEEFISRQDALHALSESARNAAGDGFSKLAALKYAPEIPGKAAAEVVTESRSLLETLHQGFAK
jgi:hypothetical protein